MSDSRATEPTPSPALVRTPAAYATGPSDARLVHAHDLAVQLYRERLHAGDAVSVRATELLHERGLGPDAILEAGLGYAPHDWTALVDHLRRHGIADQELVASGLVLQTSRNTLVDRFRDRIIFPVADESGRHVALLGRSVARSSVDRNGNRIPKYLNSPETCLYRKGQVLYGLSIASSALAAGAVPVLVEGPMDALAINCAGPSSTQLGSPATHRFIGVAPCGTGLTARQVQLLDHATDGLHDRAVVVAFDGDAAGRSAAIRAFGLLRATGAWPWALILPDGVDPALLLQRQGPVVLHTALEATAASPLADLVVDDCIDRHGEQLRWAEGQVAACRAAAKVIATLPPEHVARQVGRLVNRLELPHEQVNSIVIEAVCNPSHRRQTDLSASADPVRLVTTSERAMGQTAPERAQAAFPIRLKDVLHAPTPMSSPPLTESSQTGLVETSVVRRQA